MNPSVTIRVGGKSWQGEVLTHVSGLLRILLHKKGSRRWPEWDAATPACCRVYDGSEVVTSPATILKQRQEVVWIQVPPTWSGPDRRMSPRNLGGFRVRCSDSHRVLEAECLNISPHGMRLQTMRLFVPGDLLRLEFLIPRTRKPVQTDGVVLPWARTNDNAHPQIAVRFTNIPLINSLRIAAYCVR